MIKVDSKTAITYLMHILYRLKIKKNMTHWHTLERYYLRMSGCAVLSKGEEL